MNIKKLALIVSPLLIMGIIMFLLFLFTKKQESEESSPTVPSPEKSLPTMEKQTISHPQLAPAPKEREILGELPKGGQKDLHYLNEINPKWQELTLEELKRFQPSEVKIQITPVQSLLQILPDNNARYIEKIIVNVTRVDGKEDSYNALIDSKTGAIIQTFNKVKRDDIPLTGERPKGMTPTGVIRKSP